MNHNRDSFKISFIGGLDGTKEQITSQNYKIGSHSK